MAFPFSALATFAGGILKRRDARRADANNRPAAQVRQYEEAGINPLFGMTSGSYVPYSGASIGDAFAVAGSQYQRQAEFEHEQKLKETALAQENKSLKKQLDKVAKPQEKSHLGKYGDILPLPSESDLNAGSKGSTQGVSGGGGSSVPAGSPLGSTKSDVASERETKIAPYESTSGFMEIYNDWFGPYIVPGSDGDIMGIDELLTLAIAAPANIGGRIGKSLARRRNQKLVNREIQEQLSNLKEHRAQKKYARRWGNSPPRKISPTRAELDRARYLRHSLGG